MESRNTVLGCVYVRIAHRTVAQSRITPRAETRSSIADSCKLVDRALSNSNADENFEIVAESKCRKLDTSEIETLISVRGVTF